MSLEKSPLYTSGRYHFQFTEYGNGIECQVFLGEDVRGFYIPVFLIHIHTFEYGGRKGIEETLFNEGVSSEERPALMQAILEKHPCPEDIAPSIA